MSLIYKLFSKFFEKEIAEKVSAAKQSAKNEFYNEQKERKNHYSLIELQSYIGKPVIAVPNEWDNPIIGVAKEIVFITKEQTPMLVIEDYITGKEYMPFGVVMGFTEQRFKALAKLEPFEICSIIYRNSCGLGTFDKNKSGTFSGYDALHEKLLKTDFYKIVEQNKED